VKRDDRSIGITRRNVISTEPAHNRLVLVSPTGTSPVAPAGIEAAEPRPSFAREALVRRE
jgi:hypothetical protein